MTVYDTVIVGAGPAGLTAAIYLTRYRRSVLVVDGGRSRASWIPESHNTPGFPHGVGGDQLLARLRTQAATYGAEFRTGLVEGLKAEGDTFTLTGLEMPLEAKSVLLATGVVDHVPPLEGIDAAIRDSRVRMCPICDAYEAIDRKIAVLSNGPLGAREKAFLQTYSESVSVLNIADGPKFPSAEKDVTAISLEDLSLALNQIILRRPGEAEQIFDHLYLALGCKPQAALAVACGAREDETGNLLVDAHQMTSVAGLYAAGDVVRGLNQIAVASGEAAIAATAIHNRLRGAA